MGKRCFVATGAAFAVHVPTRLFVTTLHVLQTHRPDLSFTTESSCLVVAHSN
jgi:hypothetical protein